MANYLTTDTDLIAVADAVRAKSGTSEQLEFPDEFVSAIESITGGGGNVNVTQDANGYIVLDDDAPSGGGGFTPPAGMEIGKVDVVSDSLTLTINHSLGVVPKCAIILAALNGDWDETPTGTGSPMIFESLAVNPSTGALDLNDDGNHKMNTVVSQNGYTAGAIQYYQTNTYTTYPASMTSTSVTFATGRYYNGNFRAGLTYLYVFMT